MELLAKIALWFLVKAAEAIPVKVIEELAARVRRRPKPEPSGFFSPYPEDCGERPIDLGYRRASVAEAFGGYFAGLLEDSGGYVRIDEQIDCETDPTLSVYTPMARVLYELRRPTGPRLVIIAAAGGMGKTTLATKIVRCLREQEDAEFILGDSAKTEHINPTTNTIFRLDPSFSDPRSLYRRLYAQIGLPAPSPRLSAAKMAEALTVQLRDFSAVIVLDNLDTVEDIDNLLTTLTPLLSRQVRAIITTRELATLRQARQQALMIYLRPLTSVATAQSFLEWHLSHYPPRPSQKAEFAQRIKDRRLVQKIIEKTGGIPLIMQLVLNDVGTKSWAYLDQLPNLPLAKELLDYLWKARWNELLQLGARGIAAQQLVQFVCNQQMRGKRVTLDDLHTWSLNNLTGATLDTALLVLEERFLILNRDIKQGNFAVFPSLAEFTQQQTVGNVAAV